MAGASASATFPLTEAGLASLDPWLEGAMDLWQTWDLGAAPFRTRVVAAELAANAREHGRAEGLPLQVDVAALPGTARLRLVYGGMPFDVSVTPPPPVAGLLDDALSDGRGLRAVHRLARAVAWAWDGRLNRVEAIIGGGALPPMPK